MRALPSLAAWERTAWICAATQFFTLVGFGLGLPFLPMYVQALGVTQRAEVAVWSGVLSGSAALTMAVLAPIWGVLSDRYGRKPMLVRAMLGGAVLVGAMGFVDNVWQLLGLRLLQGAVTGSQAAAAALVAAATPANHAGYALGLISTAVQVGNTFGPALGAVSVDSLGFRGSFALGGLLLLIGALMAIFWVDEPVRQPARARPAESIWARTFGPFAWPGFRVLLLLQMGTSFVYSAAVNLLPIYLQDMDRPTWLSAELASGLAITATAITAALGMPFLGPWTDRHGPRGLLIASLVGTGVVLAIQALVPTVGLFLALRAVLGVWLAGTTATMSVITKLAAPAGREGAAFGATGSAGGLGWGLGPILGSGVVALGGIPALYLVSAALMLGLVVVAARSRSSSMIRVMSTAALPRPSSQR
ncbi:MAG TPA: MFS transporter [Chloroflexota bacterium]|nr:MFS transporter [Chloroflexota bacterium]